MVSVISLPSASSMTRGRLPAKDWSRFSAWSTATTRRTRATASGVPLTVTVSGSATGVPA